MPVIRCPICRRPFDTDLSSALPFCSDRCRQIDLGRWLDEGYSVPVDREEPEQADDWPLSDVDEDEEP